MYRRPTQSKQNQEQAMSIEKKSLISNRIASKKAIVTKPEGSKVASNKTIMARNAAIPRVALKPNSVAVKPNAVALKPNAVAVKANAVSMKPNRLSISHTRLAATRLRTN
jgi:hypothetical protein